MRAFALMPNALPSMNVMPTEEFDPVWTTSPFCTGSPIFSSTDTPFRITEALPDIFRTCPITSPACAGAVACA